MVEDIRRSFRSLGTRRNDRFGRRLSFYTLFLLLLAVVRLGSIFLSRSPSTRGPTVRSSSSLLDHIPHCLQGALTSRIFQFPSAQNVPSHVESRSKGLFSERLRASSKKRDGGPQHTREDASYTVPPLHPGSPEDGETSLPALNVSPVLSADHLDTLVTPIEITGPDGSKTKLHDHFPALK